MHSRSIQFASLLIAILAVTAAAKADVVLYTNGAPSGTIGALGITSSLFVEDSFTLTSASTLTTGTFGEWLDPGESGNTVQWAIYNSTNTASLVVSSSIELQPDGTFPVAGDAGVNEEFSFFNITLPAGNYWLGLTGATAIDSHGNVVNTGLWDENGGPSNVLDNFSPLTGCVACSNSFTIFGFSDAAPSPTPEPASLMLLGTGALGMFAVLRRRV